MDDYEDDNDDDLGFSMEAKAFERAGPSGKLSELVGDGEMTPEKRFYTILDAICRDLASSGTSISQGDIDNMLTEASKISVIKYKNPHGFILGYLVSNGGRGLTKKRFTEIVRDVLPKVKNMSGLEPEDVLRYGRYWMLIEKGEV